MKDSFLSINYGNILNVVVYNYENRISNLKSELGAEIKDENLKYINELKENASNIEKENLQLKEEIKLQKDEFDVLKKNYENCSVSNKGAINNLAYQELETSYPKLFSNIKMSMSKLYSSKYFGEIDELKSQIIELQSKIIELQKKITIHNQNQSSNTLGYHNEYSYKRQNHEGSQSIDEYLDDSRSNLGYNTALVLAHHPSEVDYGQSVCISPVRQQMQHCPQTNIPIPPIQSSPAPIPLNVPAAPPVAMQQQTQYHNNGYRNSYRPQSDYYFPENQYNYPRYSDRQF